MRIFETPLYPYRRAPEQDRIACHPVVVVGAGPVGLTAAIDLALKGVPVVVLDENDRVSVGSRAICVSKRSLEILDRLGCAGPMLEKGITWQRGKVFAGDALLYSFDLLPEPGHLAPAFVNLQQYHLERFLVERLQALAADGAPVALRGLNRVSGVTPRDDAVRLTVETPDGPYALDAEWVIACDGAGSPLRQALGLDFVGRTFEDSFLIADVVMTADFPTERWFWFDPPFNRGQSALLHKQPDDVWRIDLQLGRDIDREAEKKPERVIARLRAMLGPQARFELDWVSLYTFRCCRMERFRHGRVIFAGDGAHLVSPFGARGANSGMQDVDNLVWKLAVVIAGRAPEALLDSYDRERGAAADENILNSARATDFISPKSPVSRMFRDAVLELAAEAPFARSLVNSGRLSQATRYDLQAPDAAGLPPRLRPGAALVDAPLAGGGWLLRQTGDGFVLLVFAERPDQDLAALQAGLATLPVPVAVKGLCRDRTTELPPGWLHDAAGLASERYGCGCVYLVRPDQHVAARFRKCDPLAIAAALAAAIGAAET